MMNIAPTIQDKQKIIENVVNLAHKLGYSNPKVATCRIGSGKSRYAGYGGSSDPQ